MKKKVLTIAGKKIMVASIAAFALSAVIISSCKKDDPDYAAQFIGTWNTTSNSCGGGNSSFTISAGTGKNALATSGTVGNSGCVVSITETGTASKTSFNFPSQTFTDGCGLTYTITLSGTISGNTISYTETASGAVNITCSGTATK